MKNKHLYMAWGLLYIICVILGFIRQPGASLGWGMTLVSLGFFLSPGILLWRSLQTGDRFQIRLIRYLCLGSLGLTVVGLVLNFLSVMGSSTLGNFLHGLLVMVSAPMFSMGSWAVSIFLWAFLLLATWMKKK